MASKSQKRHEIHLLSVLVAVGVFFMLMFFQEAFHWFVHPYVSLIIGAMLILIAIVIADLSRLPADRVLFGKKK